VLNKFVVAFFSLLLAKKPTADLISASKKYFSGVKP